MFERRIQNILREVLELKERKKRQLIEHTSNKVNPKCKTVGAGITRISLLGLSGENMFLSLLSKITTHKNKTEP